MIFLNKESKLHTNRLQAIIFSFAPIRITDNATTVSFQEYFFCDIIETSKYFTIFLLCSREKLEKLFKVKQYDYLVY